ncbi:hypothetical protein CLU79DRAFT_836087 [Phycomyces nitens]|nr:hypothetical protein CLU79DRAFT_836087 [Phycomyces nitens]
MSHNPQGTKQNPTGQHSGGGHHQMNPQDASRIQSHADRTGTNQDFKSRAQSAADKNANK